MFYNIGGVVVKVFGEKAQDILQLPQFKVFETGSNDFSVEIELANEYEQFIEENSIYSLHYEAMEFYCFKVSESEYGFKIIDVADNKKLSVKYDISSQIAVIGGESNPVILLFALWVAFGIVAVQCKIVAVHSSVVTYNGKAVLFLGESGTGKSTHTRLWRENIDGVSLLNDDSPILKITDKKIYVYGSPWSGKTPCYRNEKAELVGIVRLSQAPYNKIKPLGVIDAFSALYPSCPPAFANDNFLSGLVCSIVSEILNRVDVWHLECLPNRESAELSFNTIFQK